MSIRVPLLSFLVFEGVFSICLNSIYNFSDYYHCYFVVVMNVFFLHIHIFFQYIYFFLMYFFEHVFVFFATSCFDTQ